MLSRKTQVKILFVMLVISLISIGIENYVSAQGSIGGTVCCEQTNSGAFCQNVPAEECSQGSRAVPTSCDSTSYCKPGVCYDSTEGTCLENTPQLVCNDNGGLWTEESPPQCDLGCCILGDQAAFVSLVRCKRLSGFLGLETNYDKSVDNELACVQKVQLQDKGACVYDFEFERTCKFSTRDECSGSSSSGGNGSISEGIFYEGKLCSAEELGTNCGPTTRTTCDLGKDEVYFVDSCGNPANIYDASKVKDLSYWNDVISKDESCGNGKSNAGSAKCGNCDYFQGSICRSDSIGGGNPTYGDNICANLNCKTTSNGKSYRHGESWCVNDDYGSVNIGENTVGSRFYKHVCINGEEVLEQCADFRAEVCIEDKINGFSQSACRVNRWQDCTAQTEKRNCENIDKRDCIWKEGIFLQLNASATGGGSCYPQDSPGLDFWQDSESQSICSQGNSVCYVKFEKRLFSGESCTENCECLDEDWEKQRAEVCSALGDCGPSKNWIGKDGYDKGFKVTREKVENEGG
jgi:hypothetical protein